MREEILERLKVVTPEEEEILAGREDVDRTLYNLNRSMVVDCRRLLQEGHLIELRPHTRFIHFPAHSHNYIEVVYMYTGETRHIIGGSPVTLKAGELLFLSQDAVQEIEPASRDDIAVNFIILPEFFDKSLDMIGPEPSLIRDFLVQCLKKDQQDIRYLHFRVSDVLPIQNLMENLIWMLLNRRPGLRQLDATTMGLVFLHLMNFTTRMDMGENHPDQELLLQVYRFVEENYREGELTQLARASHCSLYQLSRFIHSATGRTFTELIQEKRLRQTVYLLTTTSLSVTDVSLSVGYSNFSYFYRIFREKYGVTPREYRRQFR